jgi:23S rRNA pseudouridine955/2504/2580 synthase
MKEIIITSLEANQRIDKYVRKILNEAPLSFIYRIFRKKDVKVNGHWVKIDYMLKDGDDVKIYVTNEQLKDFDKPKEIIKLPFPHQIVYEDDNILIVNKPKKLLIHGDEKEKRLTLSNQVLSYLYDKGEYDPHNKGFIPSPAHRLDRNTSGLVIFGKNLASLQALEDLFKDKDEIEKHYLALVKGHIDKEGTINVPLKKNDKIGLVFPSTIEEGGKSAITKYKLIEYIGNDSLVDVTLVTGRTHQIRVHMQYISHPVIGDAKYGNFEYNKIFKNNYHYETQFLHAYKIIFKCPKGLLKYLEGKEFEAELPLEELGLLNKLRML